MKQLFTAILILISCSLFGQVVQNGDEFSIAVPIVNNGPGTETSPRVNITIPQGVAYVESDATQGYYTTSDSSWRVGRLFPNQRESIDITFEVTDISQFPVSITASAVGTYVDVTPGNNDSTYTINQVANLIEGEAINWSYGTVSGNVFNNDTLCNYCSTKAYLVNGSTTNGTVLWFDSLSGDYLFQFADPTLAGGFDYDMFCYGCGDGVEYNQNIATEDIPALFTRPFPKADTSIIYTNVAGDTIIHVAGGDTTYIPISIENGIYTGSGSVPSGTEAIYSDPSGREDRLIFNSATPYSDDFNGGVPETGIYLADDRAGSGPYDDYFFALEATGAARMGYSEHSGFSPVGYRTFRITDAGADFESTYAGDTGIEYQLGGDYSGLLPNSLVPLSLISDSVNRNTLLYITGDVLNIDQSNGPTVSTDITQATSISNVIDSHIVSAQVTEIDSTNRRLALIMSNGDSIIATFKDYRGAAGSGDDWGSQSVLSDSTLAGNGTLGNELTVSALNNSLVNSYEFDGNDIILTTTKGDTFRLSQAALQAAIDTDTNTTELTSVSYSNGIISIQDDNGTFNVDISGVDSTVLTDVSFVNDTLYIQDDATTYATYLGDLRTTSLSWANITSRPTINASGGNITGTLDLSAETLTLTYNDVDTNYFLDTLYRNGTDLVAIVNNADTFIVGFPELNNTYSTTDNTQNLSIPTTTINMAGSYKHVEFISFNATTVNPGIVAGGDIDGATLVIHIDENDDVAFANYFRTPDLTQLGTVTFQRNSTLVFDVVSNAGENVTSNGNILVLRVWGTKATSP